MALLRALLPGLLAWCLLPQLCEPIGASQAPSPGTAPPAQPVSFEPVWYRPKQMGFSMKAYRSSGKLTITSEGILFESKSDNLNLRFERVELVAYEPRQPPNRFGMVRPGVGFNDWVAVTYRDEAGQRQVALFRDGASLGHGERTPEMHSAAAQARGAYFARKVAARSPRDRARYWALLMDGGPNPGFSQSEIVAGLEEARNLLRAQLEATPEEVSLLLLAAQVGRALYVAQPVVLSAPDKVRELEEIEKTQAEDVREIEQYCDRVLAVEPTNAEAYYWKARINGVRGLAIRDGKFANAYFNLAEAIRSMRRAVELAPEILHFREALAVYLFQNGQREEAHSVVRNAPGGPSQVFLLLEDLRAVPLPDSAALLREGTDQRVQQNVEEGWDADFPYMRVSVYVIPTSAAEVGAFYASKFPKMKFFKEGVPQVLSEKADPGKITAYAQLLKWKHGALVPAQKKAELKEGVPEDVPDGIVLALVEFQNVSGLPFPIAVGDVFCIMSVRNLRPNAPRDASSGAP